MKDISIASIFSALGVRRFFNWMSDETYLRILFRLNMHSKLNLENPQTFNEKLQWLKLYDHKPEYTQMVDKFRVREYIAQTIGEEYLIPLLGVWNEPEKIDFDKLPDQFVLKCNHDSGGVIICNDKSKLDITAAKEKLRKHLNHTFYWGNREWPYKDVHPCIIAEKYMTDDDNQIQLTDYKFFCFNGYVDCVMLCLDRSSGDTKFYFFDREWKLKRLNKRGKMAPQNFTLPKPSCMDLMFEIAEKLSMGFPFLRVDLYQSRGKVYFGELTFFPDSGIDSNLLPETDAYFGKLIELKN